MNIVNAESFVIKSFITRAIVIKSLMACILFFSFQSFAYSKEVVVEIYKKKFIPAQITIDKGDTVIWKNIEKRQYHNVWFKDLEKEEPQYFFPDETFEMTFNDIGAFNYECGPHPKMKGVVTVLNK